MPLRGLAALCLVLALARLGECAGASRDDAGLFAGAAAVVVALPPGTPLGGYGGFPRRAWLPDVLGRHPHAFWFRPSTGVHDAFTVRALVLQHGPTRLLWLAVDLVGTDPTLREDLRGRLAGHGLEYSAIVLSASHTHSGPGAYAASALFGFVALDRLSGPVRESIVDGLERAARESESRKVPARLAAGRTEVRDITESRVHGPLDPELAVVSVMGIDGRPLALLWNYAIHGTALGRENLLLSGDVMGAANTQIEREIDAPALFVNGAVGDVSPRGRGWAGVKSMGAALAAGALRAAAEASGRSDRLAVVREQVELPAPALAVRNCVGGWAPAWLTVGLGAALPAATEVMAVQIGDTGWVTIPGELETRLGLEVKALGRLGLGQVLVAGLVNDYLGYFLVPGDYRKPSYIACASLYGERGGEILRDAALRALRRLSAERAPR